MYVVATLPVTGDVTLYVIIGASSILMAVATATGLTALICCLKHELLRRGGIVILGRIAALLLETE